MKYKMYYILILNNIRKASSVPPCIFTKKHVGIEKIGGTRLFRLVPCSAFLGQKG